MNLLRFALASLTMQSWPWSRDLFGIFGLLLAMPLCLVGIAFPLTGGVLLCADAVLTMAIAYLIGESLGGTPSLVGWMLFCNASIFLLGLSVIRLRCAELGIGFGGVFKRQRPPYPAPEGITAPDLLSRTLAWVFAPRTKVRLGIMWTMLTAAVIMISRFADACAILVVVLSFPASVLPIFFFDRTKLGETGVLMGCLVAGVAQWFILVPALAGYVRRRIEHRSFGDLTRRVFGTMAVALACVTLVLVVGKAIENRRNHNQMVMENALVDPPIVAAARQGRLRVVEDLVKEGKDVNSRGKGGSTPLMIAAERGDIEILRLLIKNGADINAKKQRGGTALDSATYTGRMDVVELMVEHGATPGKALPLTIMRNDFVMARYLLDHGADVNAKDKFGQTVLMLAAFRANGGEEKMMPILTLLLERGADVHAKDLHGHTVLQRARRFKQTAPKTIAMLEAAEASQRKP